MYSIQRETLSPDQPIRYTVTDDAGEGLYIVERTNELLDLNQQRARILDRAGHPVAQLIPPAERNFWRATSLYQLTMAGEEQAHFTIEQTYSLIDRILLRLPHYKLRGHGARFNARGSRYSEHFYELFGAKDKFLGRIVRPSHGPTYLIEGEPSPLMQMPLLLSALTIVVDLQMADSDG
ncbi:MAG TPA: hypothetical protein VFF70_09555 [Anaerolineae bacterium]|nr:hypothetical protein [Anaerolineae bacterium]